MSYEPIDWKKRVVEHPDRYELIHVEGDIYRIVPRVGDILQEGTPLSAENLQKLQDYAPFRMSGAQRIWVQESEPPTAEAELNDLWGTFVNNELTWYRFNGDKWWVPDDPTGSPGPSQIPEGQGTVEAGFFGEVASSELIAGDDLASELGITEGDAQHSDEPWLKFSWTPPNGEQKILFVPKKTFRHSISWDAIYEAGAVYGTGEDISDGEQWMLDNDDNYTEDDRVAQDAEIEIDGITYIVRLMRVIADDPSDSYDDPDRGAIGPANAWNGLMLPIHENAPDQFTSPEYVDEPTADWNINYSDEDLLTHYDFGDGSQSWGQETRDTSASDRMNRGTTGVSDVRSSTSSSTFSGGGWRPVLEVVQ